MDGKIVELKTRPREVNQSIIEVLEAVLQEAREGCVAEVAIALVRPNGAANTSWSETDNAAALVGAITLCANRLSRRLDDD